jgi:hypothetical protein
VADISVLQPVFDVTWPWLVTLFVTLRMNEDLQFHTCVAEYTIRPARLADHKDVLEMTRDTWGGNDWLVFFKFFPPSGSRAVVL